MPQSTEHMMNQRPGETEQDQSAEPTRKKALDKIKVTIRVGSGT